jgi:hypothetical protein
VKRVEKSVEQEDFWFDQWSVTLTFLQRVRRILQELQRNQIIFPPCAWCKRSMKEVALREDENILSSADGSDYALLFFF